MPLQEFSRTFGLHRRRRVEKLGPSQALVGRFPAGLPRESAVGVDPDSYRWDTQGRKRKSTRATLPLCPASSGRWWCVLRSSWAGGSACPGPPCRRSLGRGWVRRLRTTALTGLWVRICAGAVRSSSKLLFHISCHLPVHQSVSYSKISGPLYKAHTWIDNIQAVLSWADTFEIANTVDEIHQKDVYFSDEPKFIINGDLLTSQ